MIFVTGDCHADFHKLNMESFPEQKTMTKNDYVIICGDFGGVWDDRPEQDYWRHWLENRSFTTLFVDGNHENFWMLNEYPEKTWNGGRVHEISPSVLHLMRGQVFNIDGVSLFAFGGARSHDIAAGILDPHDKDYQKKLKQFRNHNIYNFRVLGESWWPEEMPNEDEMIEGWKNLERVDNKVDYIITHCGPASTVYLLSNGAIKDTDPCMRFLDQVRGTVDYKRWFFGHYHQDKQVNATDICLYNQIIRIA